MVRLSNEIRSNIRVSAQTDNVNANTLGNSQRAKSWAVGEGLIDGEDHSAKYYAGQAKQAEQTATEAISHIGTSVEEAAGYAQSAQESAEYIVNNAPEASIEQTSTGAIITTKDLTHGTTTATILNGAKGDKGETGEQGEKGETGAKGDKGDTGDDGYSPTATVSKSGNTATITITDKNGTTTANVYDGVGSITDVQVDGTSVLDGSIAKIDLTGKYDASNPDGFISGITSGDVTAALGYTPYDATNPNNYITASALTGYATETWVSNQNYVNSTTLATTLLDYVTNTSLTTTLADYQPLLVSGTNIKTINNESILGSGNININSRNVGEIVTSSLPLTDAGLHLLDGTLLQYGIYQEFIDYIADLYAENPTANYFTDETTWQASVTQYGSCGKFVYDSVSKTVRLPKISDILQGTTDINALGNLIEAGLPNITAYIQSLDWSVSNANVSTGGNAVISESATKLRPSSSTNGSSISKFGVDASLSSYIYGNSTTVQPQTIKAFVYIVIANSTKTDIQVDIDEIATDLNNKAGTDLANVTNTGKVLMSGMGMPSKKALSLTIGASGSNITIPANGWLAFRGKASAANQFVSLKISGNSVYREEERQVPYVNGWVTILIPVNAGDTVTYYYNINASDISQFQLIYAQGSKN